MSKSEKTELPLPTTADSSLSAFSRWRARPLKETAKYIARFIVQFTVTYLIVTRFTTWLMNSLANDLSNSELQVGAFYSNVTAHSDLCVGYYGEAVSRSGYIGLKGDSEENPKRSFFWLFEAQNGDTDAPLILTMGGGPGSSGLLNPMLGQSHCAMSENGTLVPNPNAWTERYNLLAIDHPIGAGFSYGPIPNNSRTAAEDVYDFLQKFFVLYPELQKNQFVIQSGSYGGTYVPNIATVINKENKAVAAGRGQPGAKHIHLESLMISNPLSDWLSHNRWALHQRCYNTDLYNATTCAELYGYLPQCLESIQFAFENPSAANRISSLETCSILFTGDTHGRMVENVKKKCDGTLEGCAPILKLAADFMNVPDTKRTLGALEEIQYQSVNLNVTIEFMSTGDLAGQPYLLYEPLLKDGIRLLHFIGKLDANCGWPGVYSFLKLIKSQYQEAFIAAKDVPWPSEDIATVRAIGPGAGNFTMVYMAEAGHLVIGDQPALAKKIIEHWVDNVPYV